MTRTELITALQEVSNHEKLKIKDAAGNELFIESVSYERERNSGEWATVILIDNL